MTGISKGNQNPNNIFSVADVKNLWDEKVKHTLDAYMEIPNVSPAFDADWIASAHIENAMSLYEQWAKDNAPANADVKVQRIENKTPFLIVDIPSRDYNGDDVVLLYGHLDKQPPMTGWLNGREPFAATYEGDRMYGRGGADDGYALFAAMLACNYLEDNNISHARFLIVIEASEESGSPDLPAHLALIDDTLSTPMGDISLVVCLDSGCLDFDHLWITQSLRGLLQVNVSIRVLNQGTHSGGAGGIVPSATHILRALVDRISESPSGKIVLPELYTEIPQRIIDAADNVAEILGDSYSHGLPFASDVAPLKKTVAEQLVANTYEPALEIIGIDGIPSTSDAGNVLRPEVTLALSFRLPPGVDPHIAAAAVSEQLVRDTPFDAHVSVVVDSLASGWSAPEPAQWLADAVEESSQIHFGRSVQYMGEGGTIPFMAMLGEKYSSAQFMVTGVLGPETNAHGPNEFLHIPTAHRVTACVATVLSRHATRS